MISTIIQTANFRASLTEPGRYSIKALTPIAKAYFRLKMHKNGFENNYGADELLLALLTHFEDGVAKLAQI